MTASQNFNSLMPKIIQIIGPMQFDLKRIKDIETIIVDGGLNHSINLGEIPILKIGDGDSNNTDIALDIKLNPDKSASDLALALEHVPSSTNEINMFGFLNGRKDHELSNILELTRFVDGREQCSCNLEGQIVIYSTGSFQFETHGTFSLFSFGKNSIKLSGNCKYQLEENLAPLSSNGLSNIGNGLINIDINQGHVVLYLNCDEQ